VLVARQAPTKEGMAVRFDDVWSRRQSIPYTVQIHIAVPSVDDLILTKRWSLRPKDIDDIELLRKLQGNGGPTS